MASNNKPSTSSLYQSSLKLPADSKLYTSERLPSFRLPRDLNLGGIPVRNQNRPNLLPNTRPNLQQKKQYTPNLNATRNKNVDVKTSRDTSNLNARGRGRGRGRGGREERGRGSTPGSRTPRNTIASSGLFSEGAGDGNFKQLFRSYRSDDSGSATLRRPTLSKKQEKVDPSVEQKQICEIYDLDMDETDESTASKNNDQFSPIILSQMKNEVKLEERINSMGINDTSNRLKYPSNIGEFLDRNTPQLFLMQLPDALPGYGPEPEPADSAESQETSQIHDNLCTMRNLEEGQIGRLVRYRSGKTKLLLGNTKFDIDLGIDPNLMQEAVSTQIDTDRTGQMINLGQINAKLSVVPDWEFLLNNIDNKKS